MEMQELAGRVAIITGAGSGIGRATALMFAEQGAAVIATDVTAGVEETAQMAPGIVARRCDAGDEEAVRSIVEDSVNAYGRLDIYHANAGATGLGRTIFQETSAQWLEMLRVNLVGSFLAVKYAGEQMSKHGKGSIIFTASVAGLRAGAGSPAYSASKAGVINLAQVGAQQLAGTNVRVNAICPGLVETGMTRPFYDHVRAHGKEEMLGARNPLRRDGDVREIAEVALFLASDRSSYINGQAIAVDGGLSSSHPLR